MKKIVTLVLGTLLLIGIATAASADFNSDEWVNGYDLGTLLGVWGEVTNSTAFADLNNDLEINTMDLDILISQWGYYPQVDLIISQLNYTTTRNTVTVTASAKNIGQESVGKNYLVINVNDEEASASISQLAPQQEFTLKWTFIQAPQQGTQISALVDAFGQINESNEDNNYLSTFIGK